MTTTERVDWVKVVVVPIWVSCFALVMVMVADFMSSDRHADPLDCDDPIWHRIGPETYRMRVPGGWLVRFNSSSLHVSDPEGRWLPSLAVAR